MGALYVTRAGTTHRRECPQLTWRTDLDDDSERHHAMLGAYCCATCLPTGCHLPDDDDPGTPGVGQPTGTWVSTTGLTHALTCRYVKRPGTPARPPGGDEDRRHLAGKVWCKACAPPGAPTTPPLDLDAPVAHANPVCPGVLERVRVRCVGDQCVGVDVAEVVCAACGTRSWWLTGDSQVGSR